MFVTIGSTPTPEAKKKAVGKLAGEDHTPGRFLKASTIDTVSDSLYIQAPTFAEFRCDYDPDPGFLDGLSFRRNHSALPKLILQNVVYRNR